MRRTPVSQINPKKGSQAAHGAFRIRSGRLKRDTMAFTPGITQGMVRQHAFELFRDKLPDHPLTLEDWVLAEKDLVDSLETDGLLKR